MAKRNNTPLAREIMIDMICKEDPASCDEVNVAISGDGSKISESSYHSVKRACKDFKKYPEMVPIWINTPSDGTGFKVLVEGMKKEYPNR